MANRSNESSRQRRARENRARRTALEARKKSAQTPREARSSTAEASTGPIVTSKRQRRAAARASSADTSAAGATKAGTARQAMAQGRLGQTPVEVDALQGSFLGKLVHVPGGMQVIMAAVLVVVLSAMGMFMDTVPEEGAEAGAKATRTLLEAYGASAVLFLAPPLILVGNALFFSLHPKRRRMWVISAVMLTIFAALMLQFVFPAAFLAYAAWRSKRIEDGPRRPTEASDDDEAASEKVGGELP